MSSTSLQVAGLASNFDWKSFVDQIMAVEHAPADRLATEKAVNAQKNTKLDELGSKLTALQTAAQALKADGVFGRRTATSATANSNWSTSAAPGTATGSYTIAVSKLATAARREGTADIGGALSATSDVAGLTLATLRVSDAPTAGSFTINGQQITVALTDSLQDVFDAIATGTAGHGDVTATYDPVADKVTLSGTGEIVLGAANDTSSILRALKLGNSGGNTIASSAKLGAFNPTASLASANLATAITAVDGAGEGTFSINGVAIAYNVNTDTFASVISRINQSAAGVTASYDATEDRIVLANSVTGDLGISTDEAVGGLLAALGLGAGSAWVRGQNAEFTVNGGAARTSTSNTLDASVHGITGLSVTVASETTQTVQVAADTASMRTKIEAFVTRFNEVQSFLESATRISSDGKGKVTAAILANNREIQAWGHSLRAMAFGALAGIGGSITRLDHLGIDFKAGTSELEVKDGARLDAALRDKSTDVDKFFHTASTGFAAKFDQFLTAVAAQNDKQQTSLVKSNKDLDEQIAAIERRLEQRRQVMESAFIQMEQAQSNLKSQQSAFDRAFPAKGQS